MVGRLTLSRQRHGGSRSVRFLAAMVALLVLLLRLVSQPEIIRDYQPDGRHGNTTYHQPGPAFLLAPLCGVLRGAFGTAGGFFG